MSLNLNDDSPTPTPGTIEVDQADVKAALNARTAFYAIAILSIFGALFLGFFAGDRLESPASVLAPTLAVGVFYLVCGYFSGKLHMWAFFVGLAVYLLDTLFVVALIFNERGRPYSLVLRAIILYYLVKGLLAALRVKEAVNAAKL